MARQNIDEEWKTDPRRDALIERLKDSRLADGARVQLNWLILDHKGKPVPLKKFKFVKDHEIYAECGLAEIRGEFVHISGADRYSDFFEKQASNGSKGGRPKTQRKPKKPKLTQVNPSETQTKPEKPSPSFSSSSSSSDSGSNSLISNSSNSTKAALAAYCERFKIRWGVNPQVQGKDAGIMGRLAKGMSFERLAHLLDAYFAMPDAGVVKAKHPINFFEMKMNEIVVFADSGKFTTHTEARQADGNAANHMLMEKLKREGK